MSVSPEEKLQDFIFNDEVQAILSAINDKFIDFNILEITGMGSQEIKHSNILSWLFGDNEHKQHYLILEKFLKKVSEENNNIPLKHYIYLSENNKQLKIYREKNNIDLLIVDENNSVVIAIENKVFAGERIDGEDGGQLQKYTNYVEKNYEKFKPYYIFLTVEHEDASDKEKWMNANYHMISDSINEILDGDNDISLKTQIVFESYIDILKRTGVVKDDKILELCKKIWDTKTYREALEIIIANKPTKENELKELLNKQEIEIIDEKVNSGVYNYFTKFSEISPLFFRFIYSTKINQLAIMIVSKNETINDKLLGEAIKNNKSDLHKKLKIITNKIGQFGYKQLTNYAPICSEEEITEDRIKEIIEFCRKINKDYNGEEETNVLQPIQ